ncbi:MAG: peptide chain release factor 2 [Deltaproteobacteria bacterium]|nr:peptide chain release factor 2 [Deltaproteobacteria bacterium]
MKRIDELETESTQPGFWDDSVRAKALSQELDGLKATAAFFKDNATKVEEAALMLELAEEAGDEAAWAEAEQKAKEAEAALEEAEFRVMLSKEEDRLSAILTINSGAGGTESCDWAAMLTRMYLRYCEKQGWRTQLIDSTEGEGAGYKSVTVTVEGAYAYGFLKAENGVHRLVRISPFDANKRRHTSFASVFVYPQVSDDIEIELNPSDLRIDTFRAGGSGGQNVQKNDTAVRITHLPTNTVVQCQSERSQLQNKTLAMKVLRSRLYEQEMEKRRAAREAVEATKKKIEWGSQIRSYVLHPYKMVKDHRTEVEVGDAERVLDGDLEPFIRGYLLSEA